MNDSPLARYLRPVRRWWYAVVGCVVLAAVAGFLTLPDEQPAGDEPVITDETRFRATHLLIRNDNAPGQLGLELVLLLAEQGDLTNRIVAALDERVSAEDVQDVQVEANATTATLSITAVRDTPEEAAELADVYADELVTFLDERSSASVQGDLERASEEVGQLEDQIDELQAEIDELPEDDLDRAVLEAELDNAVQRYASARSEQQSLADQVEGFEDSFVTLQAPSPTPVVDEETSVLALPGNPLPRLLVLAAAGLLAGIVLALAIDYLDTRIRTRHEAEEAFGLPVIAEFPARGRRARAKDPLPAFSDPAGITAEIMRALALSLELAPTWHLTSLARGPDGSIGTKTPVSPDVPPRSIVVTSPLTGDGKSTLVANLAVSIAEGGKRVLVVDCDFRRPAVGDLLRVDDGPGLRDLEQFDDLPLADLLMATGAPNVAMIRAGTKGVTPAWFRAHATDLVERCSKEADIVMFDTGPITLTNEASALLPHVDTALVVARAGRVATDHARGAIEQLTQVGAQVSGVVLIGSESRRRYGYGYYAANESKPKSSKRLDRRPVEASTESPSST